MYTNMVVLTPLAFIWSLYRQSHGTHADPLNSTEAAAAALVYCYMLFQKGRPDLLKLTHDVNAGLRQTIYYARRIAGCLEKMGENTPDEDL